MSPNTRRAIEAWNLKHSQTSWDIRIDGLAVYARFIGVYGFRIYGGFGWERVHTLKVATYLQYHRMIGGNWKTLWRHRAYAN